MKKESLIRAKEIIIEALDKSNEIDIVDNAELMINICKLLEPNEYNNNIEILSINDEKRKQLKKFWLFSLFFTFL